MMAVETRREGNTNRALRYDMMIVVSNAADKVAFLGLVPSTWVSLALYKEANQCINCKVETSDTNT